MPLIKHSSYPGPPILYFNGHFETILPSVFRKITGVVYQRERIDTADRDFLDLDWSRVGSKKLLIISHGLEGNSARHYVTGLVKLFNQHQVDALAWNNRSCSGEMNRQQVLYHHGASHDLKTVIEHVLATGEYTDIYLAGISMGGAQTLKYLGEEGSALPNPIKKAAVYSTPCNLPDSAATLRFTKNIFYKNKFLAKLKVKMAEKAKQFPGIIDEVLLQTVNDFDKFDDHFTAKLHGYRNGQDFYHAVSPDNWMEEISVPTLIVNAQNDPLLIDRCYPIQLAAQHEMVYLEMPKRGGHTGFAVKRKEFSWAEERLLEFLNSK
ncbi:alpha/beta hydrolase [Echinicola strongylocentroti]|uniref:Alpha/beta hydrolase n=1 Tax=Echinicola strongylocentroti TaxID=1795355 RepID=A0A2Z4IRB0_9BACT|nr:alpha/beta fold hydrolase [Echinicola strongylocentroti]AWW32833.1 alpha/beta hydrolase [Echinicola strongylocentroti]